MQLSFETDKFDDDILVWRFFAYLYTLSHTLHTSLGRQEFQAQAMSCQTQETPPQAKNQQRTQAERS